MNVMSSSVSQPKIRYRHHSAFPGWKQGPEFLASLIDRYRPKVILEVGSGANPTLDIKDVVARKLRYITSDISPEELAKAAAGYETRLLNLEAPSIPPDLAGSCDMVFSRMVNEHIRDGRRYHTNIRDLLAPGGVSVHCFATLYTLPFMVNRLVPERASSFLLNLISPRDSEHHGKFRAYYSWSRGPTARMIARFQDIGLNVISYDAYFGHGYYSLRLPFLDRLEQAKARLLLRWPNPHLCSFATVILQKPRADGPASHATAMVEPDGASPFDGERTARAMVDPLPAG